MHNSSIPCSNHIRITSPVTPTGRRARTLIAALVLLSAGLMGGAPLVTDSAAADSGTSKLMVTDCSGTPYDGVRVEVEIYRPGSGVIATDSGYTDDGYVEFNFSGLEDGDQARSKP